MKSMKKLIFLSLIMSIVSISIAQETEAIRNEEQRNIDYQTFIGKVLNLNSNAPVTNFFFDISKSPSLKLNLPLISRERHKGFIEGDISSTNEYTPLIKKGKWNPDAGIYYSHTWFIWQVTKFYDSEFPGESINTASINEASQVFWVWLNGKLGYNYANYSFLNEDSLAKIDNLTFDKKLEKSIFKVSLNYYFFPSKRNSNWFRTTGSIGYQYLGNNNNYSALKSADIRYLRTFSDTLNNSAEVLLDETTVKQGKFVVANAHVLDYNLMLMFSPTNDFYFGLSTYGSQTITQELKSLDVGFGLTIPIQKINGDSRTAASFTLKYDIPDVKNNLSALTLKEKGRLGFTIGVPISTRPPSR
jgi:hypothetical protein